MASKNKSPNLDTVTSINTDGSRYMIHPADVRGRFTRWRRISALFLIGIYILLPWIPVNGHPAVFLDVVNRRFHLFGITLAAQDMWLLFFFVSGLAFLLFFITAFLGRVWCGWACPQTVFLEHVFRRVERWIEGDATARKRLDAAPMTGDKLFKRVLKHGIFLVLACIIAHFFLAYFVSIPQLWDWMRHSPLEHWKAFVFVFAATGLLYLNFSWFREQLCIVICPYGRFQSALIDDDSLNVAYDYNRGNPPGPVKDEDAGDCIACRRCIQASISTSGVVPMVLKSTGTCPVRTRSTKPTRGRSASGNFSSRWTSTPSGRSSGSNNGWVTYSPIMRWPRSSKSLRSSSDLKLTAKALSLSGGLSKAS